MIYTILGIAVVWLLPLYVGHQIGKPKNRQGLLWAFFLSWLGVVIVALLPPVSHPEPTS